MVENLTSTCQVTSSVIFSTSPAYISAGIIYVQCNKNYLHDRRGEKSKKSDKQRNHPFPIQTSQIKINGQAISNCCHGQKQIEEKLGVKTSHFGSH